MSRDNCQPSASPATAVWLGAGTTQAGPGQARQGSQSGGQQCGGGESQACNGQPVPARMQARRRMVRVGFMTTSSEGDGNGQLPRAYGLLTRYGHRGLAGDKADRRMAISPDLPRTCLAMAGSGAVGEQEGKHAARSEGRAGGRGIPGSVPARAAGPTGSERQRVAMGLMVQVGDSGLDDLVVMAGCIVVSLGGQPEEVHLRPVAVKTRLRPDGSCGVTEIGEPGNMASA
jgi:hypothetical protein